MTERAPHISQRHHLALLGAGVATSSKWQKFTSIQDFVDPRVQFVLSFTPKIITRCTFLTDALVKLGPRRHVSYSIPPGRRVIPPSVGLCTVHQLGSPSPCMATCVACLRDRQPPPPPSLPSDSALPQTVLWSHPTWLNCLWLINEAFPHITSHISVSILAEENL